MPRTETIRTTTPADADALRRFRCSTGLWYEDDVDRYVQGSIASRVEDGFEAWIVESAGEVLAIASHEAQPHPADPATTITFLNVIACRADDRESGLVGAARVSRLLRPLFAEVFAAGRSPYCYTRIARDNITMRRFCEHHGFVGGPVPSDPRYMFYTTKLAGPAVT